MGQFENKESIPKSVYSTPGAMVELSDATKQYAEAAGKYLAAREDLEAARIRYQALLDAAVVARDKEGV